MKNIIIKNKVKTNQTLFVSFIVVNGNQSELWLLEVDSLFDSNLFVDFSTK